MGRNEQDWAVFWCSLLSPVLLGEIPERRRERYFQSLSQEERLLPSGRRGHVSVRTLRRQWQRLKTGGVSGLYRRRRNDRGRPRDKHARLLARAAELKREQPYRSAEVINRILRKEFGRELPRSTIYHHLKREGATRRKLGIGSEQVRCRWTREQPGVLWVGDFEHGPLVMHQGRAVKTHLSAWIDCHSRYVVEARYYVREDLNILIDSLLRAWGQHGASRELYVDNAKIYHAKSLQLACTQLNIKLLHRPPRDPAPGGLIERLFQTLQSQMEAEVRASQMLSLDDLNRALSAWLAVDYHQRVHSETKQTPNERYHVSSRLSRTVDLQTVLSFFHRREQRVVDIDHWDVRVDSMFFAVDPKFRGDRVIVQYDPYSSRQEVLLYSLEDRYLGRGKRYERERGTHPYDRPTSGQPATKQDTPPEAPITPHYLDALRDEHQQQQARQRADGLDYHSAQQRNVWPLAQFAAHLARLLGRKGGASGLAAQEMETLAAFHTRHDRLTKTLLQEAFERADSTSIPRILFYLQTLLHERNF
jgi:transposase InsO family protein